jgi:hypothetical protein
VKDEFQSRESVPLSSAERWNALPCTDGERDVTGAVETFFKILLIATAITQRI